VLLLVALVACCCVYLLLGQYEPPIEVTGPSGWDTDAAVDLALKWWLSHGVTEANIDDALNLVGEHGDCFRVSVVDRVVYSGFRPLARDDLMLFRRYSVLALVDSIVQRRPNFPDLEFAMCIEDCVVSQFEDHPARHLGHQYRLVPDPLPAFTLVRCAGSANIPFPVWDKSDGEHKAVLNCFSVLTL
jgi:hypothetical protein